MFSSLNCGRAFLQPSYKSKTMYCLLRLLNYCFWEVVMMFYIVFTCMTFSYLPLSNSSSGSDRHGILSTMHLDIGSKEWNQSCSKWLSHLEVPQDRKDDRETGMCVCVCTCMCICV